MKQNLIRGLLFFTVFSIVYILIQCFVFAAELDRRLIISAVVSSLLAWFLILIFERIQKRIKSKK
jgi:antibiotic biosynthesis monooxygenase (ABM) superfamily enzyme